MMKRWIALGLAIMLSFSLLVGCGATKSASDNANFTASAAAPAVNSEAVIDKTEEKPAYGETAKAQATSAGLGSSGSNAQPVANQILDERKIIRTANVSILVDSYEKTYSQIQTLVENAGIGYIQQSSVSKQGKSGKSGMVVVRVDADKFPRVLNSVKGLGEILDANENTEDVTDKFYDVESELRLLKYEQSRLEEYLKKIADPDTIFKTESRLTEIRHQIESLTGTFNKLGNMVKLSTITVNITEKGEGTAPKEKGYLDKLGQGFEDSIGGVVKFFGELSIFLVKALPVLAILGLLVWILFLLYRRFIKVK